MKNDPKAAQGGIETVKAQAVATTPSSLPSERVAAKYDDDIYRKLTVQELALGMTQSRQLLTRCQALAEVSLKDPLGPVLAAAKLMTANAQVAKALAQLAQVERRSRTIIETIQKPNPETAELNSIFSSTQIPSSEQRTKIRDALERALLQFLDEQKQNRERQEGLAIGSCI